MLWIGWVIMLAFAAPRSADILTTGNVALSADQVHAILLDLPRAQGLFGEQCAVSWQFGVPEGGVGARARLTWRPSVIHRRLTLEVMPTKRADHVLWSLDGRFGFDVVWQLTPVEGGTKISVQTPLSEPNWPLKRLYYTDIVPAWTACYEHAIRAIGPPIASTEPEAAAARP